MADDQERNRRNAYLLEAWKRLEDFEGAHPNQPYATVLQLRRAHPDSRIEDLAQMFSGTADAPYPAEKFRKILQESRRKFIELLKEVGYDGI